MSALNNPRFLIVDDFSVIRRIIRSFLYELGHDNFVEAEDGEVALRLLRSTKFDFVITDINMPNMNGFALLEAIKGDDSLKHIPVLVVTSEARKEDIMRTVRSGAAGFIVKPFTKSTLEGKVSMILAKLTTAT